MSSRTITNVLAIGLLGVIFAVVSGPGTYLLDRFRVLGVTRWRTLPSSFSPSTSVHSDTSYLTDAIGCEDLHHHLGSGMLFAACQRGHGTRKAWFPPLEMWSSPPVSSEGAGDGTLVVVDPKTLQVTHLTLLDFDLPFITHGIDIVDSATSPASIYIHAINHLPNPSYLSLSRSARAKSTLHKASSHIEVFHHVLGTTTAKHIRSIAHDGLISTPNDVHSIGPGEFYLTNDHKYREGGWRGLEDLGGARYAGWTETVLVRAEIPGQGEGKPVATEGVRVDVVLSGMHNNNGLGRTDDPDEIVINSAAGGVTTIGRKPTTADPSINITIIDEIHLPTTLDNPSWYADPHVGKGEDASGLIMAGLAQAVPYLATHDHRKASGVVWHVRPRHVDGKRQWDEPKVIFQSSGDEIEMVTTAVLVGIDPVGNGVRKQGRLFVTSPFGESIVVRTVDL